MLNEERSLHFFVAGFNSLALVVMLKPRRQGRAETVISIMDQCRVLILGSNFEAFQSHSQRIRAVMQMILAPTGHFSIGANLDPATAFWQTRAKPSQCDR